MVYISLTLPVEEMAAALEANVRELNKGEQALRQREDAALRREDDLRHRESAVRFREERTRAKELELMIMERNAHQREARIATRELELGLPAGVGGIKREEGLQGEEVETTEGEGEVLSGGATVPRRIKREEGAVVVVVEQVSAVRRRCAHCSVVIHLFSAQPSRHCPAPAPPSPTHSQEGPFRRAGCRGDGGAHRGGSACSD